MTVARSVSAPQPSKHAHPDAVAAALDALAPSARAEFSVPRDQGEVDGVLAAVAVMPLAPTVAVGGRD